MNPACARSLGKEGANRVLCMEQGGCAMDKFCLCTLPRAGGCKLGTAQSREAVQWINPTHACSMGQESANWALCIEQGSHAKGKPACAHSLGQKGANRVLCTEQRSHAIDKSYLYMLHANWVLCTEQGSHALGKSYLYVLPARGMSKLGAVPSAGTPCEVQILSMLAAPGAPRLSNGPAQLSRSSLCPGPLARLPAGPSCLPRLLWHSPRGPGAAASPTASPEREPCHSALVETWKTICR